MKKTLIVLAIIAIAVMQTSCEKFLEEKPLSRITQENFYQSDVDLSEAGIGMYANVESMHQFGFWRFGDLAADGVAAGANADNLHKNIDILNLTSLDDDLKLYWRLCYKNINNANTLIQKVPDAAKATAAGKKRALAEAYFFKGYAYYWLARMFKNVPLIETVPAENSPSKAPQADVLKAAFENLKLAAGETDPNIVLPGTNITADNGRVLKGSALGMLADVSLYMKDYTNAALYAKKVIDLNQYTLWPSYVDAFLYGNKYKTPNAARPLGEAVFELNYHQDADVLTRIVRDCAPKNLRIGLGVTRTGNEFFVAQQYALDQFDAIDERKAQIFPPTYPDDKGVQKPFPTTPAGQFYMYKYRMETQPSTAVFGNIAQNIHVLRYADILLIYAEAVNELSGPALAYASINEVRARAKLPALAGLAQATFRDAVAKERFREFFLEGRRFWDLQRTGKFVSVMSAIIPGIDPNKQYFPIPDEEIQKNPNLLPQNPGWN